MQVTPAGEVPGAIQIGFFENAPLGCSVNSEGDWTAYFNSNPAPGCADVYNEAVPNLYCRPAGTADDGTVFPLHNGASNHSCCPIDPVNTGDTDAECRRRCDAVEGCDAYMCALLAGI